MLISIHIFICLEYIEMELLNIKTIFYDKVINENLPNPNNLQDGFVVLKYLDMHFRIIISS